MDVGRGRENGERGRGRGGEERIFSPDAAAPPAHDEAPAVAAGIDTPPAPAMEATPDAVADLPAGAVEDIADELTAAAATADVAAAQADPA